MYGVIGVVDECLHIVGEFVFTRWRVLLRVRA